MESVKQTLADAVKELFGIDGQLQLTRSDEQFGDAATNIAMQLAPKVGQPPRAIAESIVERIKGQPGIAKAEVAGPGFINIRLSNQVVWQAIAQAQKLKEGFGLGDALTGKTVVAEYSDPNPFKVLHAGHLYTSIVGDSISNILETQGAIVHRVNFGGDVGLHVGKTMWAIIQKLGSEDPAGLDSITAGDRAQWLSDRYVEGTNAYEDSDEAKQKIIELNKRIYKIQDDSDHDSPLAKIYWTARSWSYDYFDNFYARIGTKFEKYYPESENAGLGLSTVKDNLGKVFKESEGAVIFDGEPYGLHARVFINSEGLPTYEAKDVGLIMKKWQDYHFDLSVVITGNDQAEYMKVVLKAIEQFEPELAKNSLHLTHGIVKLAGGQKMSSRKGNILSAVDVLDAAAAANKETNKTDDEQVSLGAVKYAFIKHRLGGDIIFDPAESVSLHGNSGPYLQYALVRAKSILSKAESKEADTSAKELEPAERALALKISDYPEIVLHASKDYAPHLLANYLYELAQTFNRFYEIAKIIGDERQDLRLGLVEAYAQTLSNGLKTLGIPTPESM